MDPVVDCLVVGAGPAGLTAAIYLARYHLSLRVLDDGASRAGLIPRTHNHAGYPGGVHGLDLLRLMREQAAEFGAHVTEAKVETIGRDGELFVARTHLETIRARGVLLATGVVNNRPRMSDAAHALALARGLLRYCPICDGFEVTDKKVGVVGTGGHGAAEATFIRSYTADVTLIAPDGPHGFSDEESARLTEMGIMTVDGPCGPLRIEGDRLVAPTSAGDLAFDSVYPALGSVIRSRLALELGAAAQEDGSILTDDHQRTTIPGLYAAGDVVSGLDQISHAMGEAGVAATTMRNDFAAIRPLRR